MVLAIMAYSFSSWIFPFHQYRLLMGWMLEQAISLFSSKYLEIFTASFSSLQVMYTRVIVPNDYFCYLKLFVFIAFSFNIIHDWHFYYLSLFLCGFLLYYCCFFLLACVFCKQTFKNQAYLLFLCRQNSSLPIYWGHSPLPRAISLQTGCCSGILGSIMKRKHMRIS